MGNEQWGASQVHFQATNNGYPMSINFVHAIVLQVIKFASWYKPSRGAALPLIRTTRVITTAHTVVNKVMQHECLYQY